MNTLSNACYCGSGKPFSDCCAPLIAGHTAATNAEQLMRSRFSAFCTAQGDYLFTTHHPETRQSLSEDLLTSSAKQSHWIKLDVLSHEILSNDQSKVHFKAWHIVGNNLHCHEEISHFEFAEQRWFYKDADFPNQQITAIKLSRNDACPCGSGRKFKQCCLNTINRK